MGEESKFINKRQSCGLKIVIGRNTIFATWRLHDLEQITAHASLSFLICKLGIITSLLKCNCGNEMRKNIQKVLTIVNSP